MKTREVVVLFTINTEDMPEEDAEVIVKSLLKELKEDEDYLGFYRVLKAEVIYEDL